MMMEERDWKTESISPCEPTGDDMLLRPSPETTVHSAVVLKSENMLKKLIDLGCDINSRDASGNTPLHLAARQQCPNLCRVLICSGANLNTVDVNGETALSSSIYFGCEKNSVCLIQHGADIHIADNRGTTPLYWAMFGNRSDTLWKLIEAGVHCSEKTYTRFPRNLKIMRQNSELVVRLKNEFSQPKSLQRLTRLFIRGFCSNLTKGRSIKSMVDKLPLPEKIKDYINLL